MNVLGDLLRIKKFREDKAELALARAKVVLYESEKSLEQAKHTLKEHIHEAKKKEEKLFSDLYIRLVRLKDIDSVALDMTLIKEETLKLEEKLSAAEESRQLAKDAEEEAKESHRDAVRMREKFTELVEINNSEINFEVQRLEDLELEEAGSSRHSRVSAANDNIHLSVSM